MSGVGRKMEEQKERRGEEKGEGRGGGAGRKRKIGKEILNLISKQFRNNSNIASYTLCKQILEVKRNS